MVSYRGNNVIDVYEQDCCGKTHYRAQANGNPNYPLPMISMGFETLQDALDSIAGCTRRKNLPAQTVKHWRNDCVVAHYTTTNTGCVISSLNSAAQAE